MRATFQAWSDPKDNSVALVKKVTGDARARHGLSVQAQLLYEFEAQTFEEAAAIHSLRMGWGAYHPAGEAESCPACGANYYPSGSGECWRCDPNV